MREFEILDANRLRPAMVAVWNLACEVIKAGPIVVTIARLSKSRAQEKRYHAMLNDFVRQIKPYGKAHSSGIWKALMVDQFAAEKAAMGEPLAHPGQIIRSLDGLRNIAVRPSTSQFRKHEAGEFIEYLYAQGAEMGVTWSEPALRAYESYKEAEK